MTTPRSKHPPIKDFTFGNTHDYRFDPRQFTIYVGGDPAHASHADMNENLPNESGVEYCMADRFEMSLNALAAIDPRRPILIVLMTQGGHFAEGMQMFGAILYAQNPITVLAAKDAVSTSSLLALAADRFVIRPPAQYMFHDGTDGFSGVFQQAETRMLGSRKSNELMRRIYATRLQEQGKFCNQPETRILRTLDKMLKERIDVWFSADEAVQFGFADGVYDGNPDTLRAKRRSLKRRERMIATIRRPIDVSISIK